MHNTIKEKQEPVSATDMVELTLRIPATVAEALRAESFKRRVPIAEIITTALHAQTVPVTTSPPHTEQSTTIRRVVLDVLKELGLYGQSNGQTQPRGATRTETETTPRTTPRTTNRAAKAPLKTTTEPATPAEQPATITTTTIADHTGAHNRTDLVWLKTVATTISPLPTFTDNADGTITDTRTGLVWLQHANRFGRTSWEVATANARDLASGAYGLSDGSVAGDWRLPSREELESLACDGKRDPLLPTDHPFTAVQTGNYWSSSSRDNDTLHAWVVYINRNRVNYTTKTGNYHLWPVRANRL